jgi:type VI secretion system protein ImpC
MSRSECEQYLNTWIANYVLAQDEAPQEHKARFPLREARIEVIDDKARPGCYRAIAHLRPHFQLEELSCNDRRDATA